MSKEVRIYFDKKFYKQTSGYWVNRTREYTLLAHRWVWINYHGEIPVNIDIHHIDGDKSNNEIENLKPLTRSEHLKEHWYDGHDKEKRKKQLDSVRPLDWLKSERGRKAVSEKGKEIWKERNPKIIICENCGTEKAFKRWAKFCCKTCYMKWRYRQNLK
jgi:hypothetical protein